MNPNTSMQPQFMEAYDLYADALFRYCVLRVSDRELAKDMVQETFFKVWGYIADGQEIDNMRAFLYRVARNLAIDFYRKKKTSSLEMLEESGYAFAESVETENPERVFLGREIITMVRSLDEKYRDAIILRYVEDLDIKEIASVLGESENTVSVHIHRGLKKLKSVFEVDDPETTI